MPQRGQLAIHACGRHAVIESAQPTGRASSVPEHVAAKLAVLRSTMAAALTGIAGKIRALPDEEFEQVQQALRRDIALPQARLWSDDLLPGDARGAASR